MYNVEYVIKLNLEINSQASLILARFVSFYDSVMILQ